MPMLAAEARPGIWSLMLFRDCWLLPSIGFSTPTAVVWDGRGPLCAFGHVRRSDFHSHGPWWPMGERRTLHLCRVCVASNQGHRPSQTSKQTMWARCGVLVPSDTAWCPNSGAPIFKLGLPWFECHFCKAVPCTCSVVSSRIPPLWRPCACLSLSESISLG